MNENTSCTPSGCTDHWLDSVPLIDLQKTIVVIPTYSNHHMTHTAISDCSREPVSVIVVDNRGDYVAHAEETVLRPRENLGWLRGNNYALEALLARPTWDRAVLLNDDVRLSRRFFAALIWSEHNFGADIVAASYDDVHEVQRPSWLPANTSFDAQSYEPVRELIPVGACDGTAVSITRHAIEHIGLMDAENFGQFGWGGIEDFCFRARLSGLSTIVTRAAFVNHIGGGHQTIKALAGEDYVRSASLEGRTGMTKKWGPFWKDLRTLATQKEVTAWLSSRLDVAERTCSSDQIGD